MKPMSLLIALLFALPPSPLAAAPPPGEAKKLKVREGVRSFTGTVAEGDAREPLKDKPHKVIPLPLVKGSAYVVELNSTAFRPALRWENSAGKEMPRGVKTAPDRDTRRLEFVVPADDEYQFIIHPEDGRVGGFKLTVTPLGRPGDPGIQLIESELKSEDKKALDLKGAKGRKYMIDLFFLEDARTGAMKVVKDGKEIEFSAARVGDDPGWIRGEIPAEEEGLFQIQVRGGGGRFFLRIREERLLALIEVDATEQTVEEELTDLDPRDRRRASCPVKQFKVKLRAGERYEFRMRSAQFDTFLRLEDDKGKELAWDDDGGDGLNSRLVFQCKTGGTYHLLATSFAPAQGAFTLTLRQLEKEK